MTMAAKVSQAAAAGSQPKPALRCFIAASARTELMSIRGLLQERGIVAVLAHEVATSGMTVAGKVTSLIAESDLVLAVLDQSRNSVNVIFELGYAYALEKRMLVIVPPDAEIPADLATVFSIRATPQDTNAIGFALDQLLAAPSGQRRLSLARPASGQPIGVLADRLLARLAAALAAGDARALQQIVFEAVDAGGPSVVVDIPPEAGGRPDVAVWSDDLETWVGNPLLIEVKTHLSGNAAQLLRRQLQSYIELSNSRWVLVLYADGLSQADARSLSSPPILFMRLDHFLESLRTRSLADTIRPLRNAAVHGAAITNGR